MGRKRLNQVKSRHHAVDVVPKVKVVRKVVSEVVASKAEVCLLVLSFILIMFGVE